MTDTPAQQPAQPPAPATVADVMRPPLTTADQDDHAAAAAYLMKHAGASALMVLHAHTGQPIGIITEKDICHAVADGKDLERTRIRDLMTARPTLINPTTSIPDAATLMSRGRFRHLPVSGDTRLIGMLDITDVCRALIDPGLSRRPANGNARRGSPSGHCPRSDQRAEHGNMYPGQSPGCAGLLGPDSAGRMGIDGSGPAS